MPRSPSKPEASSPCSARQVVARRHSSAPLPGSNVPRPARSRSAEPSSPTRAPGSSRSAGTSEWSSRTGRCSRTSRWPTTSHSASVLPESTASKSERSARVAELLELVDLAGLGERLPDTLSGRPAATCRPRTFARTEPVRAAPRRAVLRTRRRPAHPRPRRGGADSPRRGRHVDLRHPRPGRGLRARRSGGRDAQRQDRTDRHARRALPRPRHAVGCGIRGRGKSRDRHAERGRRVGDRHRSARCRSPTSTASSGPRLGDVARPAGTGCAPAAG